MADPEGDSLRHAFPRLFGPRAGADVPGNLSRILAETRQFRAFAAGGSPRTGGLSRRARLTPERGEFFSLGSVALKMTDRPVPHRTGAGRNRCYTTRGEREDRDEGSVR